VRDLPIALRRESWLSDVDNECLLNETAKRKALATLVKRSLGITRRLTAHLNAIDITTPLKLRYGGRQLTCKLIAPAETALGINFKPGCGYKKGWRPSGASWPCAE
jgi:hypothetical protein